MERAAEAVERRQASLAAAVSGTVRISAVETVVQFITAHLTTLQERLPDIGLELVVSHTDANLSKREADLMLRECLPDNPGLISRKLGSFAYAVYGEAGYVARHPAARTHQRYRDCAWVGYDEEHAYFLNQSWLVKQLDGAASAVRVNNGLVLHEAVRQAAGLGVLPCFAGDSDPMLVRLTPPIHGMLSTQNMIVHHDLRRVPSVRAVMDELVALFTAEAPRLLGRDEGVRESA